MRASREWIRLCEYCGCRQLEPIAELMDEHMALLEIAGDLRRALLGQDRPRAEAKRDELAALLAGHTRREEAGIFTALKAQGDYVSEVDALESEHVSLDDAVAAMELEGPESLEMLDRVVADLTEHIDKENLGIFPVAVVTLGATGWRIVDRAREPATDPVKTALSS